MSRSFSRLAVLATAALTITVSTAHAQGRRAIPRGQAQGQITNQRAVQAQFDNGYRDGLREGQTDARRNDRFNFQDERAW